MATSQEMDDEPATKQPPKTQRGRLRPQRTSGAAVLV